MFFLSKQLNRMGTLLSLSLCTSSVVCSDMTALLKGIQKTPAAVTFLGGGMMVAGACVWFKKQSLVQQKKIEETLLKALLATSTASLYALIPESRKIIVAGGLVVTAIKLYPLIKALYDKGRRDRYVTYAQKALQKHRLNGLGPLQLILQYAAASHYVKIPVHQSEFNGSGNFKATYQRRKAQLKPYVNVMLLGNGSLAVTTKFGEWDGRNNTFHSFYASICLIDSCGKILNDQGCSLRSMRSQPDDFRKKHVAQLTLSNGDHVIFERLEGLSAGEPFEGEGFFILSVRAEDCYDFARKIIQNALPPQTSGQHLDTAVKNFLEADLGDVSWESSQGMAYAAGSSFAPSHSSGDELVPSEQERKEEKS